MNYLSAKLTLPALLLLLLASCSKPFKIQGNIDGTANRKIRVIYATAQGVTDQWICAEGDRFEVTGHTDGLALVTIADDTGRQLARFVLADGDNVQVRGAMSDLCRMECKGPDVDERWMRFIADNASIYQARDAAGINTQIEAYCAKHPDDVLSTVLLLFDYSQGQRSRMGQLLQNLNPESKNEDLMKVWNAFRKATEVSKAKKIGHTVMWSSTGGYETFNPRQGKMSLLWLWSPGIGHANHVSQLKKLKRALPTLQVADVLVEPDSSAWRPTLKGDSTTWQHFWVPEGPMSPALKPLGISTTPLFVVTDSLGKILYNGGDISVAIKTVRNTAKQTPISTSI